MFQNFPLSTINAWKANYANNEQLPVVTQASAISIDILKKYLTEIETKFPDKDIKGLRIYFIRYDRITDGFNPGLSHIIEAGPGISQVSLAFVPIENFDIATLGGNDLIENDKVFTLAFCHPTLDVVSSGTGHCPPLGGCR